MQGAADRLPPRVPAFRPGGEFTVGAEDELLLTDAAGEPDPAACGRVVAALSDRVDLPCTVSRELVAEEVELATPVCRDAAEVAAALAAGRAELVRAGERPMAVGLHPSAPLGEVTVTSGARYEAIAHQLAGVQRTPAVAFQVHVGMPDEEALVAGHRVLRNRLSLLRALSAGSPFWHGRDSGLVSARGAVVRSYPRTGTPPAFGSYDEYREGAEALLAAAEAPDPTHLWWDLRPHPRYGTLEVRVMDAQCSLAHAAGLVALVQGLARRAAEDPHPVDLPATVLDENDFRAVRYGLDARVVDVDGRLRPLRSIGAEAVEQARQVSPEAGSAEPLERLAAGLDSETESARQRRVHAVGGMPALLADLVERTAAGAG